MRKQVQHGGRPRRRLGSASRRLAGMLALSALAGWLVAACDDSIQPVPPKSQNLAPETSLVVQADSLATQFYKIHLAWLGSDADGEVTTYRIQWTCEDLGGVECPTPPGWQGIDATEATFTLAVPAGSAVYTFQVAAVDDQGLMDPTPAAQSIRFYNTPPIVSFQAGTLPTQTLPAVTFYLQAVDPDTTETPDDRDTAANVSEYRAWLSGQEAEVHVVPAAVGAITFGPADFGDHYGPRTVWVQAVDDGGAVSDSLPHTWTVVEPPVDGILLVDDCRMGGFLEDRSDQSYRNVLAAHAPGRSVVLDVETIPRLSSPDLDATLSLFERVVWYTDADTTSSGALNLARGGLDALVGGGGGLFLCSGVAFGTRGAFGDQEARFRDFFGIDSLFREPRGSTNFALSLEDTVWAAVQPSLPQFRFLTLGLRAVMECFASRQDAATQSLYYYPAGTFVRATADSLHPFVNPVQFDTGVEHEVPGGGRCVYVSFPIGLPINDNVGENEVEIRALLERAGILDAP